MHADKSVYIARLYTVMTLGLWILSIIQNSK
jgi:hypothetical protein